MNHDQRRALWVAYFILGASVPFLAWNFFSSKTQRKRLQQIDEAYDSTVEDSFPASDPPASW